MNQFSKENRVNTLLFILFTLILGGLAFVPFVMGVTVTISLGFPTAIPYVNDSISAIVRLYVIIYFSLWLSFNYQSYKKEIVRDLLNNIELAEIHTLATSTLPSEQIEACELITSLGLFSPQFMNILEKFTNSDNYKVREVAEKSIKKVNARYTAGKRSDGSSRIYAEIREKIEGFKETKKHSIDVSVMNKSRISEAILHLNATGRDLSLDYESLYLESLGKRVFNRILPYPIDLPIEIISNVTNKGKPFDGSEVNSIHIFDTLILKEVTERLDYKIKPEYGIEISDLTLNDETHNKVGNDFVFSFEDLPPGRYEIKYTLKSKAKKTKIEEFLKRQVNMKLGRSISDVKVDNLQINLRIKPIVYLNKDEEVTHLNVELLNTSDMDINLQSLRVLGESSTPVLDLENSQIIPPQEPLHLSLEYKGDLDSEFETEFEYDVDYHLDSNTVVFIDI